MAEIKCPNCGSKDVAFLKKRKEYLCEDCGTFFSIKDKKRIFFSYGHDVNAPLVEKLRADLSEDFDIWIDKSEIKSGDDWRRQITEGILNSDGVVCFLSKHSVRDPGVCLDEIKIALNVKYGNIITVLLEDESEVNIPSSIASIQWLDFTKYRNCDESYYTDKKNELLEALKNDDFSSFSGEITDVRNYLNPSLSNAKEQILLKEDFYPRKWLDSKIENFLASEDNVLILFGGPGFGKSSFIARASHYYPQFIGGVYLEWDKKNSTNVFNVVKTLAFKIATRLVDYRKILLERLKYRKNDYLNSYSSDELFNELIIEPLSCLIDGGREKVVVFIDGLDEAEDNGSNLLADTLANNLNKLPKWFSFILTSRSESYLVDLFSSYKHFEILPNTSDLDNDLKSYFKDKLCEYSFDDATIERLLKRVNGSFLYASLIVESIRNGSVDINNLDTLPVGLDKFYYFNLVRLFPDEEKYAPLRRVLEAIVSLPDLPLNIIIDYLNIDIYQFRATIKKVSSFLGEIKDTHQFYPETYSYFDFTHKTFADYIRSDKSGKYFVDEIYASKRLLSYFESCFNIDKNDLSSKYIRKNIFNLFDKCKQYDEMKQFLIVRNIPLIPYFDSVEKFPEDYDLTSLFHYLWNKNDLVDFLKRQQKFGKTKFLNRLFGGFVSLFGLSEFNKELFEIYVDTVHLSGDYEKSVEIYEQYLKQYSFDEIHNDPNLMKYQIRKLHHSMFFMPSTQLLSEAKKLLPYVKENSDEYLELLFLIGGNLGLLNGAFSDSGPYLYKGLEISDKLGKHDFSLRFVRKILDLKIIDKRYSETLELSYSYFDVDSVNSRYELYLVGVLCECYRLMGDYQKAVELADILFNETMKRGMKGWYAHALLLKAAIQIDLNTNLDEVDNFLDEALTIYKKANHQWGICNTNLVISIRKAKSGIFFEDNIEEAITIAKNMSYGYELNVAEQIKEKGAPQMMMIYHLLML